MRDHGTRGGQPVPQMVRVEDPSVGQTSSAVVVFRQQVAVVEGAAALVESEVARQQRGEGAAA
jgi:hypothetical protein